MSLDQKGGRRFPFKRGCPSRLPLIEWPQALGRLTFSNNRFASAATPSPPLYCLRRDSTVRRHRLLSGRGLVTGGAARLRGAL